jgi:hypothetical protein
LDRAYKETQKYVAEQLKQARSQGGKIMVATDAWKRRVAIGGAPLMNVMLLVPGGGSFFHDVIDMGGVTKDAAWIAQQHKQIAEQLAPGAPSEVRFFQFATEACCDFAASFYALLYNL